MAAIYLSGFLGSLVYDLNLQNLFGKRSHRRAISPIIATLLLILIAIAAGVVLYAYVNGFVGATTSGQPVGTESFEIVSSSASASTGLVQLYVQNLGGNSFSLNQIYETVASTGTLTQITSPTSAIATITCLTGTCANLLVTGVELLGSAVISHSTSAATIEADILVTTSGTITTGTASVSVTLYFGWLLTGSVQASGTISATSGTFAAISTFTSPAGPNNLGSTGSVTVNSGNQALTVINAGSGSSTSATSTFSILTTTAYSSTTLATFSSGQAAQAVQFISPSSASGLTSGGTYTYRVVGADGSSQTVSIRAK